MTSVRFKTIATEPESVLRYGPKQQARSNRFAQLDFHPTGRGPITPSRRFAKLDFEDKTPKKRRLKRSKRFDRIAKGLWPKQYRRANPPPGAYYHYGWDATSNTSNNTSFWVTTASTGTSNNTFVLTFHYDDNGVLISTTAA